MSNLERRKQELKIKYSDYTNRGKVMPERGKKGTPNSVPKKQGGKNDKQ